MTPVTVLMVWLVMAACTGSSSVVAVGRNPRLRRLQRRHGDLVAIGEPPAPVKPPA
jgi:hypothetical protein